MLLVQYLSTRNILQNFLNFFYPCIHQNTKNCYFFHNSCDFNKKYSWRSVSIGFRFAALYDGSIPNMIPLAMEKRPASIAAAGLIAVGEPFSIEMILESITPTSTPTRPPRLVRTTASVRNCPSIAPFPAPIAFLSPISQVRSVTDTSMIFMTPIPPTSSDIPAIHMSIILVDWLSCCICFACSCKSCAL